MKSEELIKKAKHLLAQKHEQCFGLSSGTLFVELDEKNLRIFSNDLEIEYIYIKSQHYEYSEYFDTFWGYKVTAPVKFINSYVSYPIMIGGYYL